MARFNFPDNPVLNDEVFIGPNKFRWDGLAWVREQFDLNVLLNQLVDSSVTQAKSELVETAPATLDTINELAAAINNDAEFATTINNLIGQKADASSVSAALSAKADATLGFVNVNTNHTLSIGTDNSKILNCNSVSAITITIPLNATDAFPIGTEIGIVRLGTGTVTIVGTAGVIVRSVDNKNKIKGQYSSAALLKISTDEWVLAGSLEA